MQLADAPTGKHPKRLAAAVKVPRKIVLGSRPGVSIIDQESSA